MTVVGEVISVCLEVTCAALRKYDVDFEQPESPNITLALINARPLIRAPALRARNNLDPPPPTMSSITSNISTIAAYALRWSPTAWIHSWLLYLGIQTHVRATIDPELKPLHNVCEYLNALHVYADEARRGECRSIESYHFCSHVSKGKGDDLL